MDFTIRDAKHTDIPAMVELLVGLFSVEADFTPDHDAHRRGLFHLIESDAAVLCAESEGHVIGMMTKQMIISTAMGTRSGLIEDVVVSDKYRGKGAASAMMEEMARRADAAGCRRMQLLADEDNHPAHRFYSNRGWKPTNLRCWTRFFSKSDVSQT